MKVCSIFLIAFIIFSQALNPVDMKRDLGYYSTTSLSTCVSCLSNSANKICAWSETSSTSYCCDSWDTTSVCGGSSTYECTTDSGVSGDARYIYCPTDYTYCNDQFEDMYASSSTKSFSTSTLSTSYRCKYHINTASSLITGYTVRVNSIVNANLTIYVEETSESFTWRNVLTTSGSSASVSVSSYDDMFIIITPAYSSASASFEVSVSTSSSSYSSVSTGLSGGVIAAIVIGSIAFIGFFVGLSILQQYIRRKRMREQTQATTAAITSMNRAQEPPSQTNIIVQPQPKPEPTMMSMNPQPSLFDPSYMAPYPGQPAQPAMYDPNMAPYPPINPNMSYQTVGPVYPGPQVAPVLPAPQVAPAPAAQPQVIVQPSSLPQTEPSVQPQAQPSNPTTYYAV